MTAQDMTVAPEIEEAPLAKPSLEVGSRLLGIVPRNIDEIFRLATAIAKSGLAPKDMNTPEKITVAIMTGLELGLPPIFALNKIAVINGRPTLWGDAIPGLLWSRGFKIEEAMTGDGDSRCATCTVTRPQGAQVTRTFGVKDAKKAGLWGKGGPWTQYPDRMLSMRARAFAARDGASDVLGGLYLREEIDDAPAEMVDITPPPKRKSSSGAKKDGTADTYNTIIKEIRACPDCDALAELRDRYAQELATLPTRWSILASQEYEARWIDLGGMQDECPFPAMDDQL